MSKPVPIHPVILSGGAGTRLWPLSRASYPKQFLSLIGEQHSLLQHTLLRASNLQGAQAPLLVCNTEHRFLVGEQCHAINQKPAAIYVEPTARNTAPAIALAAFHLTEHLEHSNPGAVMLVLPADHVIRDEAAFAQAVARAAQVAEQGWLVTFGITPTSAETGYGYIRAGKCTSRELPDGVQTVAHFAEKPDAETAKRYLAEGGYFWNSGMFLFTARRFLEELASHRPDIYAAVHEAWQGRKNDLDFIRPDGETFSSCPADSIDYAVMQSTTRAAVIPVGLGWSDVGSWDSLLQIADKNADGNAIHGDVLVSDTKNSYLRSESRFVAVIGLHDVVVVETVDALLIMHKDKAQDVKRAIEYLKSNGRTEHIDHTRVHRPWGWYECIDQGDRFKVKRIMVKPKEKLSLQMHHHRAEHWVIVSGTAKVRVGEQTMLLAENQSTYIPIGQIHRLENPGKLPLHLIEVQSGTYLGEDDITRFDDTYGRTA